jgi:kynurenine formamidase
MKDEKEVLMCVPECQVSIAKRLSRRDFLKTMAGATLAAVAAPVVAGVALASDDPPDFGRVHPGRFNGVVDLTHTMWPEFPTYFGVPQLEIDVLFDLENDGFNVKKWTVNEHTGTHMDAPFHFSDMDSADEIPVTKLVVPLVVVDIRHKAETNPDAQVTPDDLRAWERRYGRIPRGACVAMNSGWADKVTTDEFRNLGADNLMHFPGFHKEATDFLMERRDVNGIGVDTLSLDYGISADFAVHYSWLPSNRWGMENLANLDLVPPVGATLVAGGPKIVGASGGPSRCIALVQHRRHHD